MDAINRVPTAWDVVVPNWLESMAYELRAYGSPRLL